MCLAGLLCLTACSLPDADGDGAEAHVDCDDEDASRSPLNVEICDGIDNDCNGEVDDVAGLVWWVDSDEDGFGDPQVELEPCGSRKGGVRNSEDCDDASANTFPEAPELCDEADNDCDGSVDEGVLITFYPDGDGDGVGVQTDPVTGCEAPDGYSAAVGDCDDTDPTLHPGAEDVCDLLTVDQDCDGTFDEDCYVCDEIVAPLQPLANYNSGSPPQGLRSFLAWDDRLWFLADDGDFQRGLWSLGDDGVQFHQATASISGRQILAFQDEVHFVAGGELFRLGEEEPIASFSGQASQPVEALGELWWTEDELFRWNGTDLSEAAELRVDYNLAVAVGDGVLTQFSAPPYMTSSLAFYDGDELTTIGGLEVSNSNTRAIQYAAVLDGAVWLSAEPDSSSGYNLYRWELGEEAVTEITSTAWSEDPIGLEAVGTVGSTLLLWTSDESAVTWTDVHLAMLDPSSLEVDVVQMLDGQPLGTGFGFVPFGGDTWMAASDGLYGGPELWRLNNGAAVQVTEQSVAWTHHPLAVFDGALYYFGYDMDDFETPWTLRRCTTPAR